MPSPLSHHLSDGSAWTLSLGNECMSLPVWGNIIATCFGFSWPGLTLASAAQHSASLSHPVLLLFILLPLLTIAPLVISCSGRGALAAPITHRQLPNIVSP